MAWIAFAALAGLGTAVLVSRGLWYVALALLVLVPAFVLLHRYPLAAVKLWLIVMPFVEVTSNAGLRRVFWLIHRFLPMATLGIIGFSLVLGISSRRLAKLGWPEVLMAGYVVATIFSIAHGSDAPLALAIIMYDRVVAPMSLYLIVRLLQPSEREIQGLLPIVIFVLITQSVIGIALWAAPGVLPSPWLIDVGERTTGSFADPDVFGTTVLFCGAFLLAGALGVHRRPAARMAILLLFVFAILMSFLTFSRASWIAGLIVLFGGLIIYRRHLRWVLAITIPVVVVLLLSGQLSQQLRFAGARLASDRSAESALSRLPVAVAAIRMFEIKPVTGWGYGQFDRYSRPFQVRVGNLVYPDKPHASHNLFLSLLAEQGIVGIGLFLAPMIVWGKRSLSRARRLRATGFSSPRLVGMLWLVMVAYIVVNNFSVMHSPFGLGMWWLTLGMIGALVSGNRPAGESSASRSAIGGVGARKREGALVGRGP